MTKPPYRALVLDDDQLIQELFRAALAADGRCEAVAATTCIEAQRLMHEEVFDIAIFDYHLPDGIGWGLAKTMLVAHPKEKIPAIILTSGTIKTNDIGIDEEPGERTLFLPKPFSIKDLHLMLDQLLPA